MFVLGELSSVGLRGPILVQMPLEKLSLFAQTTDELFVPATNGL